MNFSGWALDDVLLSLQKTISESWIGVSFIRIIKSEVIFGKAPRLLRGKWESRALLYFSKWTHQSGKEWYVVSIIIQITPSNKQIVFLKYMGHESHLKREIRVCGHTTLNVSDLSWKGKLESTVSPIFWLSSVVSLVINFDLV